jgi:hypothetical protein
VSFFNTVGLEGKELKAARRAAASQRGRVYRFMKTRGYPYTAHELQAENVLGNMVPYTSYCRSLVTLAKMGAVIQDGKTDGPLGMKVFIWRAV